MACCTVTGAVLLRLQDPAHLFVRKRVAHALTAVTVDHVSRVGVQFARGIEDVRQQGAAGERLQHLRQVRIHALALAGGQDHDRKWHAGIVANAHGRAVGRVG
jgi:hypothetical protein